MKLLTFTLLVLFGAVSLALLAMENPGYVLIAREPWSIEMSLTMFVVILLIGVVMLYLLLHGLVRLWNTPREVARWRRAQRARRARESLIQSLVSLAEGRWVEAEKHALIDILSGDMPLANYLVAACAAQLQGNLEKRDEYLSKAHQSSPEHTLATGMAQAQLQIIACQHELALATLSQLRIQDPKHGRLLGLLAQVYRELRDWDSLVRLIPELRKRRALPDAGIDGMEIEARRQLLMLPLPPGATGILRQAWGSVPGHLQRQPDLVAAYARQLIDLGQMAECETLLAGAIEHSWNDALVHLYGLVKGPDGSAQMQTAEGWMTHQNDNPTLLLTLGRLALRNKAPGKARDCLEKSILLHGPLEAYQELGRLLEQAGEHDKALELCQRALGLYAQEARMVARRSPAGQSPHQRSNPATTHYGY